MNYCINGVPTKEEAMRMLNEAKDLNPGPWFEHSINVAEAARLIAEEIEELDSELAYILGLLHDIGRREGIHGMRHGFDGFKYLKENGYEMAGKICLSHTSFELDNEVIIVGRWDGTEEEHKFVTEYLSREKESDYDKLIKLCDYISLPSGHCLIEKRLVDITLRGGFNEYTIPRWKSTFENKEYLENKMRKSIYDVLPNVKENTFK